MEGSIDVSVVIPSWKDKFLYPTIEGILENFESNFEIIPVIDGYALEKPLPKDPRVKPVIHRGWRISAASKSAKRGYKHEATG